MGLAGLVVLYACFSLGDTPYVPMQHMIGHVVQPYSLSAIDG